MNKKAIIITVSSILLVGAGIGAFMYFRNKKKSDDASKKAEEEDYGKTKEVIDELGGGVAAPDASEYSEKAKMKGSNYPLKVGSKGRRVAMLQALLNYNNGAGLAIDGVFGNQTRFALLKSGFLGCTVASSCEITKEEFGEMTLERKDPKEFMRIYNINNNAAMKAVWNKYSS